MNKFVMIVLATSTLAVAGAPAFAREPYPVTHRRQLINLWISTGDAHYARLAGLSADRIAAASQMPVAKTTLQR